MSDIEIETVRDIGVIRPARRLTLVNARQLSAAVTELVDGGTSKIVVDLSTCEFVDSSGLGALIGGLKKARQSGGDLRLAAPTPQVVSLLELTNLDQVLQPRPSVDEAY